MLFHTNYPVALWATALLLGVALLSPPPPAWGTGFSVSPPRIEISPGQRIVTLTVRNHSDRPIAFQAESQRWVQEADGRSGYHLSPELVVVPPRFEIAAQQQQSLRVGLRTPHPEHQEHAYRVYVTELPVTREVAPGAGEVSVLARFGIAVYIQPQSGKGDADIQVTTAQRSGDHLTLQLENRGARRGTIREIILLAGEQPLTTHPGNWHLLAGAAFPITLEEEPAVLRRSSHLQLRDSDDNLSPRYPLD